MTNLQKFRGFYGSQNTLCNVLVYTLYNGLNWYCVEGGSNVNATYDDIDHDVNVELLNDIDCRQGTIINDLDELEKFIDDDIEEISRYTEFNINIDEFNHDSMVNDPNAEVIRMLQGIIKNIENYGLLNCDGLYLKDINGNNVGTVSVTE